MPWKSKTIFGRLHYLKILSKNSCNRYCNNTSYDSKIEHKFQCGSLANPRIWAIYDLNGSCPADFVYIKELKACIHAYKHYLNLCTPPSVSYVYNESVTWNTFLKIIEQLHLNESTVTIDFDDDVTIDPSWKCLSETADKLTSYNRHSNLSYFSWSFHARYVLDGGCLRKTSQSSYFHRFSNRLCITDPINKYALSDKDEGGAAATVPKLKVCPTKWFDLNGRCYRMSEERKTIEDARNSCITVSINKLNKDSNWSVNTDQLNDSPKGDIVQYASQWQARLGFFLLDTIPESGKSSKRNAIYVLSNRYLCVENVALIN